MVGNYNFCQSARHCYATTRPKATEKKGSDRWEEKVKESVPLVSGSPRRASKNVVRRAFRAAELPPNVRPPTGVSVIYSRDKRSTISVSVNRGFRFHTLAAPVPCPWFRSLSPLTVLYGDVACRHRLCPVVVLVVKLSFFLLSLSQSRALALSLCGRGLVE